MTPTEALVASDGVFAALGSIAPVREYRDVLAEYAGAGIHIDDAHAVGVLGENGRGTYEYSGLAVDRINTAVAPDGGMLGFDLAWSASDGSSV